ncbi:unnamed protein product [Adineta steineri]|uniref:Enkurin domain-containing protein n=1 Tax=Adineta steineri TaxID=433720 RepID=A0A813XCC2_9BILA|nr:unnamed protein product [Adineta steineri]CAF0963053.1 unnamed protein product [Adineta steineri]
MYVPEHQFQWSAQFGPSRLRSPIPPDPGYGADDRPGGTSNRPVRIRGADAKNNYRQAIGSAGAPYLLHVRYPNVLQISKTGSIKNHLNENAKRIRTIMRETQKRQLVKEQSAPKPVKALWQSKQYNYVQSKVKQKLEEDAQRSQSARSDFLRAHENTGPKFLRSQSVCESNQAQVDDKSQQDYVKINSRYVKTLPKTRKAISSEAVEEYREKQDKTLKTYQKKQKGRVPDYIEKIKEKQDQDTYVARVNAPDPDCPPGHTKVDNNQRELTLQKLHANRAELEKKLNRLPVRNDTVILRQTKEDIEKKLIELDEAIKIFSKPKVFIKLNE